MRRLAIAIVAALLIGCTGASPPIAAGPTPGGPSPGSPARSATPAVGSPGAPIVLTLRDHQALHLQAMAELIPEFEATMAARGVAVRVVLQAGPVDDAEFARTLEADDAAGRGPDLTSFPPTYVPQLVAAGDLLDLTGRLAAWPDWTGHFYPLLRERAVQADGRIYTVPRGADVIQLFFWPSIFEANGISTTQPQTWDELIARLMELKDRTGRPPLLIPSGLSWGAGGFLEGFVDLALGDGSPLFCNEAMPPCPVADRWVVRSPGLTQAFELYARLVHDGLLPVAPLLGTNPWEPTKYFSFPNEDLAVTTQGTWGWTFDWGPSGRAPIPDVTHALRTWRFPTLDGTAPFVWGAENWMWAIDSRSAHPDLAFALLQWLTTGQALATDITSVGNLAPRDDIDQIPPYRSVPYLAEGSLLRTAARSIPTRPGIDQIGLAAAAATQAILVGRVGGVGAADLFARTVTQALGPAQVVSLSP